VVGEAMAIIAMSSAILNSFAQPNMESLIKVFDDHRSYWEKL
jgi:hypothetical protein